MYMHTWKTVENTLSPFMYIMVVFLFSPTSIQFSANGNGNQGQSFFRKGMASYYYTSKPPPPPSPPLPLFAAAESLSQSSFHHNTYILTPITHHHQSFSFLLTRSLSPGRVSLLMLPSTTHIFCNLFFLSVFPIRFS